MKRSAVVAGLDPKREFKRRQREERQRKMEQLQAELDAGVPPRLPPVNNPPPAESSPESSASPLPRKPSLRRLKEPPTSCVETKPSSQASPASSVSFSQPLSTNTRRATPSAGQHLTALQRKQLRRKQQAQEDSSSSSDDDALKKHPSNKKMAQQTTTTRGDRDTASSDEETAQFRPNKKAPIRPVGAGNKDDPIPMDSKPRVIPKAVHKRAHARADSDGDKAVRLRSKLKPPPAAAVALLKGKKAQPRRRITASDSSSSSSSSSSSDSESPSDPKAATPKLPKNPIVRARMEGAATFDLDMLWAPQKRDEDDEKSKKTPRRASTGNVSLPAAAGSTALSDSKRPPARNPLVLNRLAAQRSPNQVPSPAAAARGSVNDELWSDSSEGEEEQKNNKGESPSNKKKTRIRMEVPVNYDDLDDDALKPEFATPLFGPTEFLPLFLEVLELEDEDDEGKSDHLKMHLAPIRERCLQETVQVPASVARYLAGYQRTGVEFMFRTIFLNGGGILGDGK